MTDLRKRNANWTLNVPYDGKFSPDQAQLAVLMDIRDELQTLNRVFSCHNFQTIPRKLDRISANTYRAKRRRAKK